MSSKLFVIEYEGISFYKFTPSIFKLYDDCYDKQNQPEYCKRIIHRIRMLIELLKVGYEVYYMYDDNKILGHLVVAGGGGRIEISKKSDIVIGPIWVCPSYRGKGIGTKGIYAVLHLLNINYQNAYEFIDKKNLASIKSVEKNNYILIGAAKEHGLLKKIKLTDDGDLFVYKYKNKTDRK